MTRELNRKKSLTQWFLLGIGIFAVMCFSAVDFKFAEDGLPSNLNPIYATSMYEVRFTELMFDRLIGWDTSNKPKAKLAVKWVVAPDKKSIKLFLRQGVKWHDGKPLTSQDVQFTIQTMTSKRTQINDRYLATIVKSVSVIGPYEIELHFKKTLPEPLKWLHFKIIPAHRFKNSLSQVRRSNYFSKKPYGTGLFQFHKWRDRNIVLKRNPNYWDKVKNNISKVSYQNQTDKNIQVEVLRMGALDAIIRVRPKDIPIFERNANVSLYPYSTNDWWYIAFKHNHKILSDKRVREALVFALDRDSLRNSHLGDGVTISGPFSPNDPLCNYQVTARNQSLSKAKKLLKAAGWKAGADGVLKKRGKPLQLEMVLPESKKYYSSLFLSIQSAYLKVGVKLSLSWEKDDEWRKRVLQQKKFDLALGTWSFEELSTIFPLFHSKGIYNFIGYKNKEVDRLLDLAASSSDPVIYKEIYQKLHLILHKDLPYIFLWSLTNYSAVSSRIKNVNIHLFNYFHFFKDWKK